MNISRMVAWLVALVWFAWAAALDTQICAGDASSWLPSFGVALFVAWSVRIELESLWALAVMATIAQVSFSVEPPIAILAGHLAVVMVVRVGRRSFDLAGPLGRSMVAGAVASGWVLWTWLVLFARHGEGSPPSWEVLLSAATGTGILTLFIGGYLAKLPGAGVFIEKRFLR